MTNEEWQEMIRKNVAEHTVLSPAHIKIIKNEKTGSILVVQEEENDYGIRVKGDVLRGEEE